MPKSYNFRLRFTRSQSVTLNVDNHELALPYLDPTHHVSLVAREKGTIVEDATTLVLQGCGWSKPEEAKKFGNLYFDALVRTLAKLRIGADFGMRAPKSFFTQEGLQWVSEKTGKPALNDKHGLMVYEAIENLKFVTMHGEGVRGVPVKRFLEIFQRAVEQPKLLTEREQVALELFNMSFFQNSVDSRFLLLMSGLEALIHQEERSATVKNYVQSLISATDTANELEPHEIVSIKSSLGKLRRESITQAGKRLVKERLNGRNYHEISPEDFFEECYGIRSRLVHGEVPFPTRDEVSAVVAQLEVMLSDLLSPDLLNVGPQG